MGTAADLSHASFDCCICVGRAIADPANVRCLIARLVAVLPSNIMQPQNYYHWAWHRRGKAVRCHRLNGSSSRLQSKPNCMLSYVWHIWRVVLCCCSFFFISERTLWHRHSEQWIRAHHRLHVLVHPSLLHTHTLCVCNARIYHTNNWLVCVCTWTGAAALTMLCPFHLFLSLYSASCSPRALPLVWSAGVCVHFVTPLVSAYCSGGCCCSPRSSSFLIVLFFFSFLASTKQITSHDGWWSKLVAPLFMPRNSFVKGRH